MSAALHQPCSLDIGRGRHNIDPMRATAAERRARQFIEHARQRESEEQARRDRVIAEFNGDLQALAAEVLRHRHGVDQLARALNWVQRGAPFAIINPGPHWPGHAIANDWAEK